MEEVVDWVAMSHEAVRQAKVDGWFILRVGVGGPEEGWGMVSLGRPQPRVFADLTPRFLRGYWWEGRGMRRAKDPRLCVWGVRMGGGFETGWGCVVGKSVGRRGVRLGRVVPFGDEVEVDDGLVYPGDDRGRNGGDVSARGPGHAR